MTRPRATNTPVGELAAVVQDLSARLRILETVGHQHYTDPYLTSNAPNVYLTANESIPAGGVNTTVAWDAVDDNTWGSWNAGSPSLLTVPFSGRFVAILNIRFAANATGNRFIQVVRTSDSKALGSLQNAAATVSTRMSLTTAPFTLAAGDSVYAQVNQTSAGALNIEPSSATDVGSIFGLVWLS